MIDMHRTLTRRRWLQRHAVSLAALAARVPHETRLSTAHRGIPARDQARLAAQAERLDLAPWQTLAQQAVETARAAGATYADARITRTVVHQYNVGWHGVHGTPWFAQDDQQIGIGVRALVNGYWGFSASAVVAPDEAVRLARDAVDQATVNAKGPPWTVDLGTIPVAKGTWTTPHRLDPFSISIEEKQDFIMSWRQCAAEAGVEPVEAWLPSWLRFVRQERVTATTDGALFTQTLYESGGLLLCGFPDGQNGYRATQVVHGIDTAGTGWELFLDAQIPEQFRSGRIAAELAQKGALQKKPSTVGKYTLVCDGATMARLLEGSLGIATQLDRALGYEANAGGTSFLDDPLGMLGNYQVASPVITVMANRSAPKELATVKWDEEGVEPPEFPLIKDGVLVDFQTTRERAAWLAPYYTKADRPVRSTGCAAAFDAHGCPLPLMPNLALTPSPTAARLEDLVADVKDGILIEGGTVSLVDSQVRTGLLTGPMREIKNGRAGKVLQGGAVLWTSQDLWKHVQTLGGPATQMEVGTSAFASSFSPEMLTLLMLQTGQPPQVTSHSVRGVAATLPNQVLINPMRKA